MAQVNASISDRLKDAITCLVCKKKYNDPRILPCLHSFCCSCLNSNLMGNKTSEDKRTYNCSKCEQDFQIPASDGVPKNFFINKLLELVNIEKSISAKYAFCELCFDDQAGSVKSPLASYYCVECRQKICEDCCKRHKKSNFLKDHSCVDFKHVEDLDEFYKTFVTSFCASHTSELIKLYCNDCSTAICLICYAEEHPQHNCQAVDKEADRCRELLKGEVKILEDYLKESVDKEKVRKDKRAIVDTHMTTLKRDITDTSGQIKQLVDKHAQQLLLELELNNKGNEEKLEQARMRLEKHMDAIKCVERHIQQLGKYGSSGDICNAINTIERRCIEMGGLHRKATEDWDLNLDLNQFEKSQFLELLSVDGLNIVGVIKKKEEPTPGFIDSETNIKKHGTDESTWGNKASIESVTRNGGADCQEGKVLEAVGNGFKLQTTNPLCSSNAQTRQLLSVPISKTVTGIIIMNDSMIVVQSGSSSVGIYDKISLVRQSNLEMPAISDPYDAVGHGQFIYVSERTEMKIHEINPKEPTCQTWDVGHLCTALSVTNKQQLLAVNCAMGDDNLMREYNIRDGSLIREIGFKENLNVRHAVALSTDEYFVITQGVKGDRVRHMRVVDKLACIVKSYGAGTGTLTEPIRLILNKDGSMFVLDLSKHTVILLSQSLEFVREIVSKTDLSHPYRMCFDDATGRLYIADGKDKFRVMSFNTK